MKKIVFYLFGFLLFILNPTTLQAQLSAPGSSGVDKTGYSAFPETDSIYVFCTESEIEEIGRLRMSTELEGTKTFYWEKYNKSTAEFEFYFSESSDALTSDITGLANGCYRITVTQGAGSEIDRAWIFNNWTITSGSSPDTLSNCEWFKLIGEFTSAELNYYDLADNTELQVYKNTRVQWKDGNEVVAAVLNPQIFDPPTKNTDYTLRVYDKFNCEGTADVTYESIVTKAVFSVDPQGGEAPLEVVFNNQSENGDIDKYEWFLFRDLGDIKRESENTDGPIDSIMIVAYDENPIYTYEYTGDYMVKLVSKKESKLHVCVDTVYLEDYIAVDSSFIAVPNVFTPNGDGTNDNFVVKFWSMESIEISIFNRWGRKIHYWESENVRGFEGTWTETVWDGRLMGGRYASPGVYYYNVVGEGRDGERRRAHGFFHLFRNKN